MKRGGFIPPTLRHHAAVTSQPNSVFFAPSSKKAQYFALCCNFFFERAFRAKRIFRENPARFAAFCNIQSG